jgi:hypothetical protein
MAEADRWNAMKSEWLTIEHFDKGEVSAATHPI